MNRKLLTLGAILCSTLAALAVEPPRQTLSMLRGATGRVVVGRGDDGDVVGTAFLFSTNRLAVTVPVRLSWAGGKPPTPLATPFASASFSGLRAVTPEAFWPGRMSLNIGVAIRVPLVLRVD